MAADEGQFVKGKHHPSIGTRGNSPQAPGGPWNQRFLVLQSALGAFAAFYGKAGYGYLVAYGGLVLQGENQEQDVIFDEDVFAEEGDAVVPFPQVVEFLGPAHKALQGESGRRRTAVGEGKR